MIMMVRFEITDLVDLTRVNLLLYEVVPGFRVDVQFGRRRCCRCEMGENWKNIVITNHLHPLGWA